MKKKFVLSIAAFLFFVVFAIVRVSVGHDMEQQYFVEYALTKEYMERGKLITAGRDEAIEEGNQIRESFEEKDDEELQEKCKASIQEKLKYAFDNFDELQKGREMDSEVYVNIMSSLAYVYYLSIYSDYDDMVYTEREHTLGDSLVNKYVDVAYRYAGRVESNTQEKADLFEAKRLGRKLSKNLDEEVDIFVEALVAVIEEGTA